MNITGSFTMSQFTTEDSIIFFPSGIFTVEKHPSDTINRLAIKYEGRNSSASWVGFEASRNWTGEISFVKYRQDTFNIV